MIWFKLKVRQMSVRNLIEDRKRGNVTMMWVTGLPAFMIMFMFLASLAAAWMTHSTSQVAADAGSLAVTKELDRIVEEEMQRKMNAIMEQNQGKNPGDPGYVDPYYAVLGTKQKRQRFMESVVWGHKSELASAVGTYAKKNGGGKLSLIRMTVHGRIEVTIKTKFNSPIFKEDFKNIYVRGSGTGPKREYLSWVEDESIQVRF
ncbi:TadE/TadG family type IV pilus assembly protein [Kroppenstedtia sanguinis]|uniref:TadE/TadG family type IV pilus assembly protein n=2 Tax=Kroppenstedtia TaxID=1274351 RepID=A0ABW4CC15_9BACL